MRLLSTQTQDGPGQPPAWSANFSAVGRHAGTGHVLLRPQSRVMLGLNTVGLIITLVNVSKNTKVENALERGYYVVDAFIYIIMLCYKKFAVRIVNAAFQKPPASHIQNGVTYFPHHFTDKSSSHWVTVPSESENGGN